MIGCSRGDLDFGRTTAVTRGDLAFLARVDVDGSFGTVPHASLTRTLEREGVDSFYCRFLHTWLTGRSFQVGLTAEDGARYSNPHWIGRGLPRGGVSSPVLWLVHFNSLRTRMVNRRLRAMSSAELHGGEIPRSHIC